MKIEIRICLLLLVVLLTSTAFSQNFISENKVWRIGILTDYEPCCRYRNAAFRFQGDSVINDTTYIKLYESDDESLTNWYLRGLWRENNDSIYQLDPNTGKTNLIYDFNITEGDSFKANDYRVLHVDSVRLKEWGNRMRKHWYLSTPGFEQWGETVWIEGVGQLGLFTRSTESGITGAICRLLCFTENGQIVYQNPEYNTCFYTSSLTIQNPNEGFKVYPNPVSGELFVQLISNINESYTLELFSVKGELVKTECLEAGINPVRLDVNNLKSGIYILRLISTSGTYEEKVIIKE